MHDQRSVVDRVDVATPALQDVLDPPSTGREPSREPDDRALLVRCRRGEAAAWTLLVRRYERLVYSVALRNGLDRDDAADVTQATFTALLESIDELVRSERLASWLMTVARRGAWRHRRQAARERERADLLDPATTAPDAIERFERAELLHGALSQLAEPCRELLAALYLDPREPSYAEVAARTGRAVGTIGPARARCLRRLRALMGDSIDDAA